MNLLNMAKFYSLSKIIPAKTQVSHDFSKSLQTLIDMKQVRKYLIQLFFYLSFAGRFLLSVYRYLSLLLRIFYYDGHFAQTNYLVVQWNLSFLESFFLYSYNLL